MHELILLFMFVTYDLTELLYCRCFCIATRRAANYPIPIYLSLCYTHLSCCPGVPPTVASSERTSAYAFCCSSISTVSQLVFSACAHLFHSVRATTTCLGNSRAGDWNPRPHHHAALFLSICTEDSADPGKGDRTA